MWCNQDDFGAPSSFLLTVSEEYLSVYLHNPYCIPAVRSSRSVRDFKPPLIAQYSTQNVSASTAKTSSLPTFTKKTPLRVYPVVLISPTICIPRLWIGRARMRPASVQDPCAKGMKDTSRGSHSIKRWKRPFAIIMKGGFSGLIWQTASLLAEYEVLGQCMPLWEIQTGVVAPVCWTF